jgi:S-adenosylmethionine:tRNA ribosyltransferase-isomerase
MHPKAISISDYNYTLPDNRIAAYPIAERDNAKLLVYKNGDVSETTYRHIATHIAPGSLLVFNNTRVIQARILFTKPSGGVIEIFCLEPYEAFNEYNTIMQKTGHVQWKCLIGGASKWKEGNLKKTIVYKGDEITLTATLSQKLADAYVVTLSWTPQHLHFAEVLDVFGDVPLPPYIKRKAEQGDKDRYQTIYAKAEGSVAAPTAGLHFTPAIFESLAQQKIATTFVTLHVGAGTFKPVKAQAMEGHEMHSEWIDVQADAIQTLLAHAQQIVAVGTTSLRTLETLYWMGVKAILQPTAALEQLSIQQWDVYEAPLLSSKYNLTEALTALLQWMQKQQLTHLITTTQILIAPGYQYRVAKAIVTNFHQPQSTLLLLVAAAIGEAWKDVYQYAMDNQFRFLSYGDGSLLYFRDTNKI